MPKLGTISRPKNEPTKEFAVQDFSTRMNGRFTDSSLGKRDPATRAPRIRIVVMVALLGLLTVILCVVLAKHWIAYIRKQPELVLSGVVENQEIRLGSKIGGRVSEVFVSEGQIVEAGKLLLRLDVPELISQRSQLLAAKEIAQAKLELATNGPLPEQIEVAEADLETVAAQLAELKAGHRKEEIAQAKFDVTVRRAEESRAKKELERMKQLQSSNSVSPSEVESIAVAWHNASGQVAIANERLHLLEAGPREEAISAAQARVRRASAELNLLRRGTRSEERKQLEFQIQEIEGKLCEMETHIAESMIVSPSNCTVEVIPVRRGDIALPNQPVVRVRSEDDLWIKAYVPETELGKIRLNQSVEIAHDSGTHTIPGRIVYIASASEFTPRNIQSLSERQHQVFGIKVRPQDASGVFKSGMAAQVRVAIEK